MTAERAELGPRKQAVLRAVVEEYVRTGEPVGSETVSERHVSDVSSATIRAEMAALEELGYLSHPHTSAGRTPTDVGYRQYVDLLPPRERLREAQRRAIARFFEQTAVDIEEVLTGATRLLSSLTQYAGLALAPSMAEERIVRAEVVELGSALMLLAISEHGRIYKVFFDRPEGVRHGEVAAVARKLASLGEVGLAEAGERLRNAARDASPKERELLAVAAQGFEDLHRRAEAEHVVVGGVGSLAVEVATWRRDTMRRLFEALDRESDVLGRLLEIAPGEEVTVRIGREHPATELWEAALVAAPYRAGETSLGTIGVVGPTRMDYPKAISAVRAVARRLSDLATTLGSHG